MKKEILGIILFVFVAVASFAQLKVEGPEFLGDTYKINLYKDKCTDGKCKDGGSGTLRFKDYGTLKEFTGTFGPEGSFVNGLLTFLNGDTYQGSFLGIAPETKGKYAYYTVKYDSGTYVKRGNYAYTAKFVNNYPQGFTEIKYENGAAYTGKLKDGFFEGYGKMVYANGLLYEGEWKNGHREGKGSFHDNKDPQYYFTGVFKDDYPTGPGLVVTKDSPDTLTGDFSGGRKTGYFKKVSSNGNITWQKYQNDTLQNDNLTKIAGGFCISGNCKSGKGVMMRSDGVKYEGDIKNGEAEGIGTLTFSNGTYTGEVRHNKRNGKGKTTWLDGSFYEGDYKDDIRTGQGYFEWAANNYYKGSFDKNSFNGYGSRHYKDGDIYEGNFVNDTISGQGTYRWLSGNFNGDKYVGEWKASTRTGKGIYYYANGNIFDGNFLNNDLSGSGTFTYANGDKYISDNWSSFAFYRGKMIKAGQAETEGALKNGNFLTQADIAANEQKAKQADAERKSKQGPDEHVYHAKKNTNLARDYWVELITWDCIAERKYYVTALPLTKYHATPFGGHFTMQVVAPDNTVAFEAPVDTYFKPRKDGKYTFQVKFYQDKIIGDGGANDPHTSYVSGLKVEWTLESIWNN